MLSRSAGKTPKGGTEKAASVEAFFGKWVKIFFILALVAWLVLASVSGKFSSDKFVAVMFAPVLAEVALLGAGGFFVRWIVRASPMRTLLSVAFLIILSLTLVSVDPSSLIAAVPLVVFGLGLAAFAVRKYYITRDLGFKKQDPVITVGMSVFMTSVIVAVFGDTLLVATLLLCSAMIYLYRSHIFDTVVAAIAVLIFYTQFRYAPAYTLLLALVGSASILLGVYVKQKEYLAGLVKGTPTFRRILISIYTIVIGTLFIVVNITAPYIVVGLVFIITGGLFAILGVTRYAAKRSLEIRAGDPIKTIGIAILLTSMVSFAVANLDLFILLLFSSVVLMIYQSLTYSILSTIVMALILIYILGILYGLVVICLGIVAVPIGIYVNIKKNARISQATLKKK
ncbi:MAG: hypothetical protein WED04_10890 [Promethearchaeati archaeon SRVP18_Atabeyarchaeia-1]